MNQLSFLKTNSDNYKKSHSLSDFFIQFYNP